MSSAAVYRSWGGLSVTPATIATPTAADAVLPPTGAWLAYGNGRSYGDSCLTSTGTVIDMRGVNRIIAFDRETGRLQAEAGVTLGDILRHVAGSGWFPAVLPGTQHVTLAGAIANDIHGKNHHRSGTFGAHVTSLVLLRSTGERLLCSPDTNVDLFHATIGGLGLTGLIAEAGIALMRVPAEDIMQEAIPLERLGDFFRLAPALEKQHEYVVAWLDSLASGAALGRGVLLYGDHAADGPSRPLPANARLTVPFTPPLSLVRTSALRVFNTLYRWRALSKAGPVRVPAGSFFFPLDTIGHWNRLYGPGGLRQHQCLLPIAGAEPVVRQMLTMAQDAGHGSLLTVIKLFGDRPSPGMLSFPRPGVTLTLDFAHQGERTQALLEALDQVALAAGGRVNPYKDARMSRETFAASFPDTAGFRRLIDPSATSDFARRVGLISPCGATS